MKLSNSAIQAIQSDPILQGMIAHANGKSLRTVERWLRENDDDLTKEATLQLIESKMGVTRDRILEPVTA